MHVLQLDHLFVHADDGNPSVAAPGEQMVEGVFVVIHQLLPLEHQRVVTADGRHRCLQRRTARTRFLPSSILLDEIPGGKRGHLIGPLDDPITVLDLDAFVGIQVQDQSLGRNLGLGRGGNRKQQNRDQGFHDLLLTWCGRLLQQLVKDDPAAFVRLAFELLAQDLHVGRLPVGVECVLVSPLFVEHELGRIGF